MERLKGSARNRAGYQQGFVSIVINILLFALKYWAGILSGSVALMADAWHSLSDSFSSVLVIAGIRLGSKRPTRKYPFGFGRWEQIITLFIAFLLVVAGYEFIREAMDNLKQKEPVDYHRVAIWVTLISITVKEALAQYSFRIYRKTGNPTLKADGWHHRSDALSSVLVLAGILLGSYFWWIDGVMGIIISLMLFYAAYEIMKENISKLLGEEPDPMIVNEIKTFVTERFGKGLNPHHFHLHRYGDHSELTFHIQLPHSTTIIDGHRVSEQIESFLREKHGVEATIHVDPEGIKHAD
ncbi:MAG: cation diffusion facilitator family transporter [Bacteroidales bacterium]